ncbi:MAG: ABC transporter substrate-binding protein [Xylophilus ampelinus]
MRSDPPPSPPSAPAAPAAPSAPRVRARPLTRRGALALAAAPWLARPAAARPAGPEAAADAGLPGAAAAEDDRALRIVGPWELVGLDPSRTGYLFTRLQVAETLLGARPDGGPAPGLAVGWTVSPDQRAWRFPLRPGARFHDGSAVTADAAAAALRRARGQPGVLRLAPIAAIDADGDAVRIALERPFALLPGLLAHSATQVLAPSAFDAAGRVVAVVGSGPYRIAALAPPQGLEAAWFDGHGGPRPAVRRLRYLSAGRAETRALLAESGQADLAFGLDPAAIARLRRTRAARGPSAPEIAETTLPRTTVLKLNAGHRWLADPRARQALSLALDRTGIARALMRAPELAATQLFPPGMPGWHQPGLAPLGHDPAGARRLLAALGWAPGADGMLRRPGGEPFALTLQCFVDRPELPILATILQEQWRQVGIAVRVAVGNSSDVPAGHRSGALELALMARSFSIVPDPVGTLLQDFGSAAGGDWGAMGWSDPALADALQSLARDAHAPRDALRARVAAILQRELPVIPLTWYRQAAAVGPRVDGFSLDPLELSYRLTDLRWAS